MIRFFNVTKQYPRGTTALNGLSLSITKREFVFLTGASGAGKSTLLRMLYLEERPTSGEVKIGDLSSLTASRTDVAKLRRKLGIIFQDFGLLEDRTVEQNVAFALEVIGVARSSIPGRVSRVLTRVGLASKTTALPRELSGGEQQRVAIARALVNDPFLLVADEPTGNLDDRATRGIFQLLREINAAGTAVVMATHNLELTRRSGYRVVELDHGRIVFDSAAGDGAGSVTPGGSPTVDPIGWGALQ
ncbi:MAG: cell division ATP-binding protein FtsE [Gemmatimonadaceae bacterium]